MSVSTLAVELAKTTRPCVCDPPGDVVEGRCSKCGRPVEVRTLAGANRCGDCAFWMTRFCLKEVNVNGWNKGPSAGAPSCGAFVPQGDKLTEVRT